MKLLIAIFVVFVQIFGEKFEIRKYFECADVYQNADFLDICDKNITIYKSKQRSLQAYTSSAKNVWFFELNLDIPMDTLLNSDQFSMIMKNAIIDEVKILELGDLETLFIHKNICIFTLNLDFWPQIEEYVRQLIFDRKFVVVLRNGEIVFWNFNNIECLQNK
ncbi:unnamed protein product [Caenorhabditis angaria]|uniref:DUF38 domain-containing protein n=1 Tax=Caenorhabditis angaria TaxID=860376 RepID=A0A9P1NA24_9PELO|nr:unnamed protein product [Caenorhabditis angaria]